MSPIPFNRSASDLQFFYQQAHKHCLFLGNVSKTHLFSPINLVFPLRL